MSSDNVRCSGPLFDGQAQAASRNATDAIRRKLADEGERRAASALAMSVRNPGTGRAIRDITETSDSRTYQTGKYTLLVTAGNDETIVTTDLASYGPWLEGSGSRNLTTRFKGYHSFRRAAQELDRAAGTIAEETIRPYIAEMND